MEYRVEDNLSYKIHMIKTDKFKTVNIKIDKKVIEELIKESNYNEYGARKLDKIIKNNIENIIIDELLEDNYNIRGGM